MIQIIVFLALGFFAFKAKPDAASFKSYLESMDGSNPMRQQQQGGWFNRLTAAFRSRTLPDFKVHDYGLFMLAQTEEGTQFIGIFGAWFLVASKPVMVSNMSAIEVDGQAEQLRENGVRFKADKKYSLAATSFLDAARQYSQLVDSGNRMDAGKCYEDASVMFKLAGQEQRSFDALEQAASTFETVPNLETRAAKIFETLSQKVVAVDGVKALRFLQRAQDLFLQVGDGRALYVEISKCNTLSQLQRFEEGFKGFESLIAQVAEHSALKFSAGKYALSAGVCAIGIPNVHLFTQLLQTCSNNPHVSFAWEYEKLKLLHEALKVEDLDKLNAAIEQIPKASWESWYEPAFEKSRASISELR